MEDLIEDNEGKKIEEEQRDKSAQDTMEKFIHMEEELTQGKQTDEDREIEDEVEDMDIGDLDLEGIEKACVDVEKGYVLQEQVMLLKEAILRA